MKLYFNGFFMPRDMGFVALHLMKGLFSTAYFPAISYFSKLTTCAEICFETQETYQKQTYRNRCKILTSNGLQNLIIPVTKVDGNHTQTARIIPDYTTNWPVRHLRSLHTAYKSSPFYDYFMPDIEEILLKEWQTLAGLNETLILKIADQIKLKLVFVHTTAFEKSPQQITDFRNHFNPKKTFPKLYFPPYYQVFSDRFAFEADLSILDLLFNKGPESLVYLKHLKLPNPDRQF